MKLTKQEKRLAEDLILCLIGFSLAFITPAFVSAYFGLFSFIIGLGLAIVSLADAFLAFENKPFLSFRKNKKGVVWIWAVAIATLVMAAIVYFIVGYPLDLIIDALIPAQYEFTGIMGGSFNLCRQIIAWLLGLTVFIVLIWSLVNAHKRGADYPAIG